MKPVSKPLKFAGLGVLFLMPVAFLFFFNSGNHNFVKLPVYGPKTPIPMGDTLYHTIPYFSFTNQNNETYSIDSLDGKIFIANFIFTRCLSICPDMTSKMIRLQMKMDDPAFDKVKFITYTVDPEHDTPEVLHKYAWKREADVSRWTFLTGNKQDIYKLGAEGYFLAASEDVLAPGGFLHSEKFVLVDSKKRIRGIYNGTDFEDVDRLYDEVRILIREENMEASHE